MTRPFSMALVLTLIAAACETPPPEAASALSSRVELAAGDVFLVAKAGQQRLITGAMLPEEALVSVGTGGRALIRLGTGTAVFLRSGSEAAIHGGSLDLRSGELWADVPAGERELGRFSAGDVTVSASDAGLDVAVRGGETQIYVARGLAVVNGPGGRAEVQSGERALMKGKGKPAVDTVDFWEDWTGGMADRALVASMGGRASGRIYGIDPLRPGAQPEELQILSQEVRIYIRDGIAQTVVDQRFFNPSSTPLEGWYWFTVPEGASVERFALEVNGAMVQGEMIERKQAAAAYEAAVQAAFDPALLEWVDGRTFRARIYPIPPTGERRVVLAYSELLPLADGVLRYVYPMASGGDALIQEFSLTVDLGKNGDDYEIATLQDARVEKDRTKVAMRRSGFSPKTDFLLELKPKDEVEPLRAARFATGREEADYVMLRWAPEVEWGKLEKVAGDVVVVLDTSAGGDQSDRQVRADAVEAILRALSAGDRFAVVAADLRPRVVYPAEGLANADDKNVSAAVEKLAEVASAGATDLGEMFSVALDLLYDAAQPAVVYVGDGRPTVGETTSIQLAERLRRALGDSRARLFTIAVGEDANYALLERLARVGGGRSFAIHTPEQSVQEALRFVGMVKTPTMTDLQFDAGSGLDQVFSTASGKVSEGEEVIVLGRTHHALPKEIAIRGRLGGKPFETKYGVDVEEGKEQGYIPVLWARQYLTRLMGDGEEPNRGRIISLGLNYSLMTPFTSFLVLESNQAFEQQGIQRRQRYDFSALDGEPDGTALALVRGAAGAALLPLGCSSEDRAGAVEEKPMDMRVRSEVQQAKGDAPAPAALPPSMPQGVPADGEGYAKDKGEAMPAASAAVEVERKRAIRGRELDDALGGPGGGGGGLDELARAPRRDVGMAKVGSLGTAGPRPAQEEPSEPAAIATGNLETDEDSGRPMFRTGVCSDASSRPLSERRILWQQRIVRVADPAAYARIFFEAGERCELPHFRDRKVMLDLIEQRANNAEAVRGVLAAFTGHPGIQKYLRQRILRRTLDPNATMGLYFPDQVRWDQILAGLAAIPTPEARLAELRRIMDRNPADPMGRAMLVKALAELGFANEAMAEAKRLQRDGLASPLVIETLCDLEAAAGRMDDARRTCSELVEFNADDPAARERLGDLFLRHGWYAEAYRQYTSLTAMLGESALSLLKLAVASAGMGKVDEALRIERKVASGDGEPGPDDPRRFARIHSAARLALMLLASRDQKDPEKTRALERSLKRTQVFGAPTTLAILVWEDFEAPLVLVPRSGETVFPVAERVASSTTGLAMLDLGETHPADLRLFVELAGGALRRSVPFTLLTVTWDGKGFTIDLQKDQASPKPATAA